MSAPTLPPANPNYVSVIGAAPGFDHMCASTLELGYRTKCWGNNRWGGLGLGDTHNRGDDPQEMGFALPFTDFGVNVETSTNPRRPIRDRGQVRGAFGLEISPPARPCDCALSIQSSAPSCD